MIRFMESQVVIPTFGPNVMVPALQRMSMIAAEVLLGAVKSELANRTTTRSGRTLASWTIRKTSLGAEVYSKDPVATYLNYGTGKGGPYQEGYIIRPKRSKVLHWIETDYEDVEQTVEFEEETYLAFVKHPGIKARKYVEAAEDIARPLIREMFEEAARDATRVSLGIRR